MGEMKAVLSYVQLLETPWTATHKAPLPMEFSRQEYWSGLLFSSPGDLPEPGVEPASLRLVGGFLYHFSTWETQGESRAVWF